MEVILGYFSTNVLVSIAVFAISFISLFAIWLGFLRALDMIVNRSKIALLEKIAKDINSPMIIAIFMVSLYLGTGVGNYSALQHPFFNLWAAILVLVVFNIAVRASVCVADDYVKKTPQAKTFRGMLFIMKNIISGLLYSIAIIMVIEIINPQLGMVIALFGALLILMIFVVLKEQIDNVLAGIRLEHQLKEGDYVRINEIVEGYVKEIGGKETIIQTLVGTCFRIPNKKLAALPFENFTSSGGVNVKIISVAFETQDYSKALRELEKCAKTIKQNPEVAKEYDVSVKLFSVKDGKCIYHIKYFASPFANFIKIEEPFKKKLIESAKSAGLKLTDAF